MACRSSEKSNAALEEVKKGSGSDLVEIIELDLSSLRSVEKFASEFINKKIPLHILLNNAGIMAAPYSLTKDGIENHFGTNHIGHFYLTLLLFDLLDRSQPSRIVNVSATGHSFMGPKEGIRFDSIDQEAGYSGTVAYGQSKLANVLFTKELARRVGKGKKIYVNTNCPGFVDTGISRHVQEWNVFFVALANFAQSFFALTPEKGALTQLYLATSGEVEKKDVRGEYYASIAKLSRASDLGCNEELARKLWDFSVDLIEQKVGKFEVPESLR